MTQHQQQPDRLRLSYRNATKSCKAFEKHKAWRGKAQQQSRGHYGKPVPVSKGYPVISFVCASPSIVHSLPSMTEKLCLLSHWLASSTSRPPSSRWRHREARSPFPPMWATASVPSSQLITLRSPWELTELEVGRTCWVSEVPVGHLEGHPACHHPHNFQCES